MTAAAEPLTVSLPRLHPGQLRRRQHIRDTDARFVVTMCGRRWGKSIDGVEWIIDGALDGEPCAIVCPTFKYLGDLWRDVTARLRPLADAGGKVSEQDKRIELPTGGVIECWSADTPDPARGRKYKRLFVDEAGIIRGLLAMWNTALRPTLVDLKGHAWFSGTPKGRTHDFVVLFAKGESGEPGWTSFRAATKDNPYIPPDEIEAAKRDMPEPAFRQEFEGIPADDGANPFGLDAIRACVAKMSEKEPVSWGWDFARAEDWTVGIGVDEDGVVCRFSRWQLVPWKESLERVAKETGTETYAYGDSTGIGDVIVEDIQRKGVMLHGVKFSQQEKQRMMERLRAFIQRGLLKFPEGVILNELETFEYSYIADGRGGVRYSAPTGLHDDCVMALALACKGLPDPSDKVESREEWKPTNEASLVMIAPWEEFNTEFAIRYDDGTLDRRPFKQRRGRDSIDNQFPEGF